MRSFFVSDHVALKRDVSIYGLVRATSNDPAAFYATSDVIVAHGYVPANVLDEFLTTSVPPNGYVYVEFAHAAAVCSLVGVDDIVLVSRAFKLGDSVKQDGSPLTGTVVNISETYILEPVFPSDYPPWRNCTQECPSTLPEHFTHPNPHVLLYDVPAREVTRAQDVIPEDCIIRRKWPGEVEYAEYDTVVMLADFSIAVISNSVGLRMPIAHGEMPLITSPELGGLLPPGMLASTHGWPNTIPVSHPRRGDFVIVDRPQLRNATWLCGSYDPKVPSEGIVLDCRAHEVTVDWISGKTRRGDTSYAALVPEETISIYKDIQTFRGFPEMRTKKDVIIYDAGRMPVESFRHNEHGIETGSAHAQALPPEPHYLRELYSGQELEVGMRVKFRDLSAAAVKYQGIEGSTHGMLHRVTKHASGDWNLDEYKIVFMQQSATVMWQDGSVVTVNSTSLTDFALFEADILPTDIVFKREGMRQRPLDQKGEAGGAPKDFDEMAFFERPHDLLPAAVGVVQSVDPIEKVARVRWFKEPKIEILAPSLVLAPSSRFGAIGDEIEDVSLFEIMAFPSLFSQRGDICFITAPGQLKLAHDVLSESSLPDHTRIGSTSSHGPGSGTNKRIRLEHSQASPLATRTSTEQHPNPAESPPSVWIGQVVALGLDGLVRVRLGTSEPCRDVFVDADSVLTVFSSRSVSPGDFSTDDGPVDVGSLSGWSGVDPTFNLDFPRPISQTVEYEGGERLDNDSGDENWVSDEDVAFEDAEEVLHGKDRDRERVDSGEQQGDTTEPRPLLFQLEEVSGSERPAQFLVLDRLPPSDQFGLHTAPPELSLKRLVKEHQILAMSLPEGEIYVRTYESRMDLLRCLIIGPRDTPYENAPFLIDLQLPAKFPEEPPVAHFHSWTGGLGRINPNLYEEGKVCLSLLGTWSGENESEKWSNKATLLQVLVSLQGLVLVKRPFYNEAGFEGYEHDKAYARESDSYSEKVFAMSRRFVKSALLRPPGGLEDILAWLYLPHVMSDPSKCLLGNVIERGNLLLQRSEEARTNQDDSLVDSAGSKDDETRVFLKPLSRGAASMLRRLIGELQAHLDRVSAEKTTRQCDDDDDNDDEK
ncbi:hypothetical protein AYO20_04279 [Fonsecaea nubica]|uniref:UBC core domain-containing protein n=1 Tax=Fonsecaea nubica TaxID=856822 RepID=A0A178D534_9EURO|nr:hypothetical protein AYO20_04279 [Fonsecaea nubica]OAL36383.1 hypothetical protein AYO20_04279 [Fonsecaea nubica]